MIGRPAPKPSGIQTGSATSRQEATAASPARHGGIHVAREGAFILDSGDRFPALTFDTVGHGRLDLPDGFGDAWGVLLIYRAHW
jgi:hypothetical protein